MQKKKLNALIESKTSEKGFTYLKATIYLDNGDIVKTDILLNPYDKKVTKKLTYKVAQNVSRTQNQ